MHIRGRWRLFLPLFVAAAYATPALAQQPSASDQAAPSAATPAPKKKPAKPKSSSAKPPSAAADPSAAATTGSAKPPKPRPSGAGGEPTGALTGGAKPTLLGQYGDWGAYAASPGGKKVCFAIAKPASSETSPPGKTRNAAYMFIASRPSDKVSNEVSIVIGYPFKSSADATLEIGSAAFSLYTQQDGAWIKNAADEPHLIEAMRAGQNAVVKGVSAKGTRSTDTFSLKGLSQALDRSGQDCQ